MNIELDLFQNGRPSIPPGFTGLQVSSAKPAAVQNIAKAAESKAESLLFPIVGSLKYFHIISFHDRKERWATKCPGLPSRRGGIANVVVANDV